MSQPELFGPSGQRPQAGRVCSDMCGNFDYVDSHTGRCAIIRGDNLVKIGASCPAERINLEKALLRERILRIGK